MVDVALFIGSALPPMSCYRAAFGTIEEVCGIEVPSQQIAPDSIAPEYLLYRQPRRQFEAFVSLLSNQDIKHIFCVGGGTGAARGASYSKVSVPENRNQRVYADSDCMVWALLAWLHGRTAVFGLDLSAPGFSSEDDQGRLIEVLPTLMEATGSPLPTQEYPGVQAIFPLNGGGDVTYKMLPMSLRPLTQIYGDLREQFLCTLQSDRYFLMLEDDYPPGKSSWLGFYEDLTHLQPFVDALDKGGGILGFADVPEVSGVSIAGIIRESFDQYGVPVFYGIPFGHNCPGPPLFLGESFAVSYDDATGLVLRASS